MISALEFAEAAQQLAAAWQRCLPEQPQWRWVPSQRPFAASLGGGHLARTFTKAVQVTAVPHSRGPLQPQPPYGDESSAVSDASLGLGQDEDEVDAADPASTAGTSAVLSTGAVDVTFHAAFHPSYRVPVLYFEVVSQGGKPLGLDAALDALPRLRQTAAQGQPHTVVTREEHVVLGRPFFMLHPCQTEAVMLLLQRGAGPGTTAATEPVQRLAPLRYLLAWLCVAGQPLGLDVPAALWLAAMQQSTREQAAG